MQKVGIILFAGFSIFILWIIFLANTGQTSIFFNLVAMLPYGDKVGHFMIFGFLTLFANMATKYHMVTIAKQNIYLGSTLIFVFVSIEELSQYFTPSRTLDAYDFLANLAGIITFSIVSHFLKTSHQSVN